MLRHPLSILAQAASSGMGALDVASRNFADVTGTFYANEGGFIGYETELLVGSRVGGGSPDTDTFQAVAYVRSITPGDMSSNIIDKTHLRSVGAHREKLVGLRDSGPFTAELIWVPTDESQSNEGGGTGAFTDGGLIAIWRNREERNFIIRLPGATGASPGEDWPFQGAISRFQPGVIGLEELVGATVEITPLGDSTENLP